MNKLIIILSLFTLTLSSYSQNETCAIKTVFKSDIPIPKNIFIPDGYVVSYIQKPLDLNNDGLKDFVFDYNKETLRDGDSIFVAIYFQHSDSSFHLARLFHNLYPIYFKDYSIERYRKLDSNLKEIMDKYDENPLRGIYYKKNQIEIEFAIDAMETYTLVFNYNKQRKTWLLEKRISYVSYNNQTIEYDVMGEEQISIEEFNYFDYL
ncbi:MAG: hypothetical protein GQ564_10085 [Bacteroidales bacterium]|nr:hypothetical protein [Bacteroidales bacterium]